MTEYVIVDAHMHTYPTAEAGRLAMTLSPGQAGYVGTIEEALAALEKGNIAKGLMTNTLPVAYMRDGLEAKLPRDLTAEARRTAEEEITQTIIGRQQRQNLWTCQVAKENLSLYATIAVHPIMGAELMRQEIRDKVSNHDAKGIKLHPSIGRYYPNDHVMWLVYETASELDIPILFHCGPHPNPLDRSIPAEYTRPSQYEEVLASFPKLKIVLAHMGVGADPEFPQLYQPYYDEAMAMAKKHPGLYFDLSDAIGAFMPDADFLHMVREVGVQRIMFGSDFPWFDPGTIAEAVKKLALGEEEKRLVLGENAIRLYKL